METKFTKGNWFIKESKIEKTDITCQTVLMTDLKYNNIKSPVICDLYGQATEEGKANAKLISASPIMYDYIYKKSINGDEDAKLILATIE